MSNEVTDFLRSVKELQERREEEDEARSRELEEKLLQEKRERQARRAERARSISPQKSSPANTPSPVSHRISVTQPPDGLNLASSPPVLESTGSPRSRLGQSSSYVLGGAADDVSVSTSPTKENDSPFDSDIKRTSLTLTSPATSAPPTRSPLSWQRRPTSQTSDRPKSRPLSMVAAENAAARSTPTPSEPSSSTEPSFSRDQIAQALGGKDPSFFRQTADRGQNSAAYRKTLVEDQDTVDLSSMRAQLPGMEVTKEKQLDSPLNLTSAQRFDPPSNENESPSDRQSVVSPGGRTSPSRPLSPTKGMGGFVQSAMMKRSDSVKRWSVNSPAGLQRADSVVSNRNSLESSQRTSAGAPGSRLSGPPRDGSATPTSRPSSSAGKETESQPEARDDAEKTSPPTSPSKTMDPRRWSPTKSSSWLEAALNKPESPKPKPTPPPSNQPAWMVELNKAKAQKGTGGSVDLGRNPSTIRKHEVKTGGLMRSSPMGSNVKPAALGSFPSVPNGPSTPSGVAGFRSSLSKTTKQENESPAGENERRGSVADGPSTPPKKDFRAGLKPRAPLPGAAGSQERPEELKNVFGTLRKTKTQNYVAPDELKNNILRGKAALNITGGPQKTERRDDFKEAILKKKEDFKKAQQEGRGVARSSGSTSEAPLPEGLAKKLEMSRSGTISRRDSATSDVPSERAYRPTESNRSSVISTLSRRDSADVTPSTTPKAASSVTSPVEKSAPVALPSLTKESSAPGRLQNKTGGGLADRFNPALAGLLARGPPGMATGGSSSSAPATKTEEPSGPGPQLNHMTKNRARGPKRKAPSATKATEEASKPAFAAVPEQTRALPSPVATPAPEEVKQSSPALPQKPPTPAKPQSLYSEPEETVISLVDSSKRISEQKPARAGQAISFGDSTPKTRPRSPTKIHEQVAAIAAKAQQASQPTAQKDEAASQPSSPRKLDMKRMSRFLDEQTPTSPKMSPERSRPSSPTKGPFNDMVNSDPVVSAKNGATLFGGVSLSLSQLSSRAEPAVEPAAPESSRPRSPLKSTRPLPETPRSGAASPQISTPLRSPTKYGLEISSALTEFFGPARPRRNYQADATEILMHRPVLSPKISTQKVQLFQVSGDGKKLPVPPHNERVLFEREMYLCPHTFTSEAGKKISEVYFWSGDEVPESTVEDAHLFVSKEARAFGGKLVKLTQGKESPEFLQALGGIVTVRRGSNNKYDSLAPSILCGRRYLGQVVFDEVDFSPASLCSGFPYLVTQQGKCFLWKGKGSDVDELSCARLVGMDLALMGELVEVEDGSEPAGFWDIFGSGANKPHSADHWRLKPNYDKYSSRLFRSDPSDKKQIVEVSPFSQADLLPSNIYILDAFFEMYIIVGARSQHQYAAFHNALEFAQEYAILASGMEDRPFVPISTVVLEGIPRDLKSVFRKWDDNASPTAMNPNNPTTPNLKRGRSLRIVPLNQALLALTG
ncbi:hypothetical protein GQ53DRAFT_834418 [Thozetella sp. PMI_491]|nr:hypothetical protein GQ53DRAFT_834418 [Thozetella sp. PMI_491]